MLPLWTLTSITAMDQRRSCGGYPAAIRRMRSSCLDTSIRRGRFEFRAVLPVVRHFRLMAQNVINAAHTDVEG